MSNVLQSLQRDGYAVVRNILTTEKCNEIALQIKKQSKGLPNMAHSNIVWDVRCLPEITTFIVISAPAAIFPSSPGIVSRSTRFSP